MSFKPFSRRAFLKYGVLLGSGLIHPRNYSQNERIQVAVIGCGNRGTKLIRALSHLRDARIVAVCDLNEKQCQQAKNLSGGVVYTDWKSVMEKQDVDAVVIAAPDALRPTMALAALGEGKDVFCVPPMALTPAEAGLLKDEVLRNQRVFQMGIPFGIDPAWEEACRLISQGWTGKLVWAQAGARPPVLGAPSQPNGRGNEKYTNRRGAMDWRRDPRLSLGAAATELYMDLAPLLELRPDSPVRVSAAGGCFEHGTKENPDSLVLTCQYADGFTIALTTASYQYPHPTPTTIRGEHTVLEHFRGHLTVRDGVTSKKKTIVAPPHPVAAREETAMTFLLAEWLRNIQCREKCTWNEEKAFRTQEILCQGLAQIRKTVV